MHNLGYFTQCKGNKNDELSATKKLKIKPVHNICMIVHPLNYFTQCKGNKNHELSATKKAEDKTYTQYLYDIASSKLLYTV